jgi:hypothetical protein
MGGDGLGVIFFEYPHQNNLIQSKPIVALSRLK